MLQMNHCRVARKAIERIETGRGKTLKPHEELRIERDRAELLAEAERCRVVLETAKPRRPK